MPRVRSTEPIVSSFDPFNKPESERREYGTGSVISKRKLKNWYIAFYRDGKQHFIKTDFPVTRDDFGHPVHDDNHAKAENKLEQKLAKKTLDVPSDAVGLAGIKYETIRENLIQEFKRDKVASLYEKKNEDGSISYSVMGLNWLDEYFEGQSLKKMADTISKYPGWVQKRPEVEEAWQARKRREQRDAETKGASPKNALADATRIADAARDASINRSLSTLRSMYSRYSKANPKKLSKADIPYMPRIANADNVRQGFCTHEDFQKIYNGMPEPLRPLVLFLYYTGMRSGVAQRITWSMVEFDAKKKPVAIRVPATMMKNKTAWEISLVGPLEEIATALSHPFQEANTPIFDSTNFRWAWNTVCDALKFGTYNKSTHHYHGLHPHDFRRSAAKNLVEAGVDKHTAMQITGHRSPKMFDRYHIVTQENVKNALLQVQSHQKATAKK
jgi:integrase